MQFRKRDFLHNRMSTGNRSLWRRTIPLIVTGAAIIGSVLLVCGNGNQPQASKDSAPTKTSSSPASETEGTMKRSVRFDKVAGDNDWFLRYVAMDEDTNEEVSFEDWIRLLSDPDSSETLSQTLTDILMEAPYEAYRLETPGVSPETVSKTRFEFVLVDNPSLGSFASTPDPSFFAEYLSSPACNSKGQQEHPPAGCIFANLSGDATLVSPNDWSPASSPSKYSSCYGHLANFIRGAPQQQVLEMWKTLGNLLQEKLLQPSSTATTSSSSSAPLWFSTAGEGVPYLHFRLCSRPKYYHYASFTKFSS